MKMRRLVLTGAATLTLVFASGALAFAASDTTTSESGSSPMSSTQMEALQDAATESLETAIANLVEDETLTEDEAEAILAALETVSENTGTAGSAGGPFAVLDEDQISALLEETDSLFEEAIEELVSDETLTEDEAEAILEGTFGAEEKMDLTDDQLEAVKAARAEAMETAVENLLEAETLTEDEAEAILAVPEEPDETTDTTSGDTKPSNPFADLSDEQQSALTEEFLAVFETALDELVSDDTITEEMAETILAMYSGTAQTCTGPMMQQGQQTQQGQMMQQGQQTQQGQTMQQGQQTQQGQMMQQSQPGQMSQMQNQKQSQPMMRLFMNGGR